MKFLLFFVSIIFSAIFYIFHNFSNGLDFLGKRISNSFYFDSLSSNLLIESFLFFIIGVLFLYFFSNIKNKSKEIGFIYKAELLYLLFYSVLFYVIYFIKYEYGILLFSIIILFLIGDLIFNHISNIKYFIKKQVELKIFGLILNYTSSLLGVYFIDQYGFNFLVFLILSYSVIFNISIHNKYTNYISLIFSILLICFGVYLLYFYFFELYIYLIS